jgi:hypothetical protein
MDWQELEKELANVNTVYVRQGASVQPGRALPRDLDRALVVLEIACINAVRRTAEVLGELSGYLKGVDDTAIEVRSQKACQEIGARCHRSSENRYVQSETSSRLDARRSSGLVHQRTAK